MKVVRRERQTQGATLLELPHGAVETGVRDGLMRLPEALGVEP